MSDWKWNLLCALPYGLLALWLQIVGPAKILLWIGIRLELVGMAVQDLAMALQQIFSYQRARWEGEWTKAPYRLRNAEEDGKFHAAKN